MHNILLVRETYIDFITTFLLFVCVAQEFIFIKVIIMTILVAKPHYKAHTEQKMLRY